MSLLAGPILRRLESERLVLWLVTHDDDVHQIEVSIDGNQWCIDKQDSWQAARIGANCVVHLLDIQLPRQLPENQWLTYQVFDAQQKPVHDPVTFVFQQRLSKVLHGSCRNPHHESFDALIAGAKFQQQAKEPRERASLLIMSGDQIYADDVSGPMLLAIRQLIDKLGLYDEQMSSDELVSNADLGEKTGLYQRQSILPDVTDGHGGWFGRSQRKIFSSMYADNHLITMAEFFAMYLLVWSSKAWSGLSLQAPNDLNDTDRWKRELAQVERFKQGLGEVESLLACTPTYMIFDDHDVTDDWNLTAAWEQAAYGNPLSKRIIGNGLISYWLMQGWGNSPDSFPKNWPERLQQQDQLIDEMLEFEHFHFTVDCQPKLVVLDTRTQRWRSESSIYKPSGLMDWEALTELQQQVMGEKDVILVSAAPIFGVKFIEALQRFAVMIGQPLMVDAENWMAHPGSALAILQLFKHRNTPQNFIILSGDVHYSFVSEVDIRFRKQSPKIWQITSSGIKNAFHPKAIKVLDWINRVFYQTKSPLNLFTKRKRMRVRQHHPQDAAKLHNESGLGLVTLGDDLKPLTISELGEYSEVVFYQRESND